MMYHLKAFNEAGFRIKDMVSGLKDAGDQIEVETAFRLRPKQFGSTQQTPILYDGHLYGVRG